MNFPAFSSHKVSSVSSLVQEMQICFPFSRAPTHCDRRLLVCLVTLPKPIKEAWRVFGTSMLAKFLFASILAAKETNLSTCQYWISIPIADSTLHLFLFVIRIKIVAIFQKSFSVVLPALTHHHRIFFAQTWRQQQDHQRWGYSTVERFAKKWTKIKEKDKEKTIFWYGEDRQAFSLRWPLRLWRSGCA